MAGGIHRAHGRPPGTWAPIHRAVHRVSRPVESFLATEVAGGVVLLVATVAALAWANSPWRDAYHGLWSTVVGIRFGSLALEEPLHFWVNDALMTLFFFVVGLEIRREIARGELSDLRRASLPIAAALGGMIVPALLFTALNAGREAASGWGVPMATDIAFAVGVLTILGRRVPPALRILLLALAVIDDVGAILVIGVFYSHGIVPMGLVVAGAGLVAILVMQRAGVRRPWLYVLPGAVVWLGMHQSGVHATLAGVIVGLLTPARAWFGRETFAEVVQQVAHEVRSAEPEGHHEAAEVGPHLDTLAVARREALAPVDYLQHAMHRVVAFGVMPLFAFVNAGVSIGATPLDEPSLRLIAGVVVGLVVGKPLGIVFASWLATRLGIAALPRGVTWPGVLVVGLVGGIGFTMSLFIAELAFEGAALETAKLAVLTGSVLAAVAGLATGAIVLAREARASGAAESESEAESSTEA